MDPVTGSLLAIVFCAGLAGVSATKKPTKEDEEYEDLLLLAHAQGRERERARERRGEESDD